jgi:GH15 family glucan-1,4-alpha-glucosidase
MIKRIGDYGIIGNSRTAALVGNDGSIEWLCLPFLDSPSVFAALLDQERGGRFAVAPAIPFDSTSLYRPGTNILTTTFRTGGGRLRLTDFIAVDGADETPGDQGSQLYRCAEVMDGEIEIVLHFEPRFDYARRQTRLEISNGAAVARSDQQKLVLLASRPGASSRGMRWSMMNSAVNRYW